MPNFFLLFVLSFLIAQVCEAELFTVFFNKLNGSIWMLLKKKSVRPIMIELSEQKSGQNEKSEIVRIHVHSNKR